MTLIPVINVNDGTDSIIGIIGSDMKDFFRTLTEFNRNSLGVPCICPKGYIKKLHILENMRKKMLKDLLIFRSSSPSGYLTFSLIEK